MNWGLLSGEILCAREVKKSPLQSQRIEQLNLVHTAHERKQTIPRKSLVSSVAMSTDSRFVRKSCGVCKNHGGKILHLTEVQHSSGMSRGMPERTKIAHHRSLAIFTADESIAGNSAARILFTRFHCRKNRGSLAILFARGNRASSGLNKSRDFSGSSTNRRRSRKK